MNSATRQAEEFSLTADHWSENSRQRASEKVGSEFWDDLPEVQRYFNSRISGDPLIGPVPYALEAHFRGKLPLARCLSLGCGSGWLERHLATLGAFEVCDAVDVSAGSIQQARQHAAAAGIKGINYQVADINRLVLEPGSYDAIWVFAAMHHFEELEHVAEQIRSALKPGGLLILFEYVGPARFQFPERQKEITNHCLHLLPARYRAPMQGVILRELQRNPLKKGPRWLVSRLITKTRDGDIVGVLRRRLRAYRSLRSGNQVLFESIVFPSRSDVISVDPTEAVRSEEILPVLQRHFEILEKKDAGGNILQFLLTGIASHFSTGDETALKYLRMICNIEAALIDTGELKSDFAFVVAKPTFKPV